MPVRNERPSVKPSTRRSSRGLSALISRPPHSVTSKSPSLIQNAKRTPSAPPTAASKTLSVNNCLTNRQRLAPTASRTAISFLRDDARTSNRFATFAHAISSTTPTTPANNRSGVVSQRREFISPWLPDSTPSFGRSFGSSVRSAVPASVRRIARCSSTDCWNGPARLASAWAIVAPGFESSHQPQPPNARALEVAAFSIDLRLPCERKRNVLRASYL